jgi:hypothetical protein
MLRSNIEWLSTTVSDLFHNISFIKEHITVGNIKGKRGTHSSTTNLMIKFVLVGKVIILHNTSA